jgi:hypothetical protein
VSVADQHQFTGACALFGKTYSPARSSGAHIGRILGIIHDRGCGRGDGARDLRPSYGISLRDAVATIDSMLTMERAPATVT